MAKGIKGITIEIGGNTAPLQKALKSMETEAKNAHKELAAVNKAASLDPGNITMAIQKQKLLTDAIKQTKERLDSLKKAEAETVVTDKNAGQFRALQREIVKAEASLKSLKKEQKSVSVIGTAFEGVKVKVQAVLDKLAPVAKGLQNVGKAAGGISSAGIKTVGTAVEVAGKGLAIYTGAAVAAGTAAVGMAVKSAKAADDINTISKQTGLSTEEIQKFQFASEQIDVPLETLTGSMAKLTRNMASATDPTKGTGEAFARLGVQVRDSNGELRDNEEVFNDAINALGQMSNETERDALAMELFGKSAQDLNPLILGGADALKKIGDEAEQAGLIMSQKALDDVNKFSDGIDQMQSTASASGNILGSIFAGSLGEAVGVINTELPNITGSLSKIFSGEGLHEGEVQLRKSLTDGLMNIISGFAKDLPKYIAGFNAVIFAIIGAISAVLPVLINDVLPVLIDGFNNLINGLIDFVPELVPLLAQGAITLFMGLLDGINVVIPQLMEMLPGIIQQIGDMLIENLPTIITAGFQILIGLIGGITNAIPQLLDTVVALIPVIVKGLTDNLPALITAGIDLIVALAVGLPKAIPAIILALPEIINAIINGLMEQDWGQIGVDILKGLAGGLVEGVKAIGSTIKSVAGNVVSQFKNFFGIQSPSTVFRDIVGKNLALGLGVGFDDEMGNVTKKMQDAVPKDFATSINVTTNQTAAARNTQMISGLNEAVAKITAGTIQQVPQVDGTTTIHLYLDGVYNQTVKDIKRKNQRAGRVIVPVGV